MIEQEHSRFDFAIVTCTMISVSQVRDIVRFLRYKASRLTGRPGEIEAGLTSRDVEVHWLPHAWSVDRHAPRWLHHVDEYIDRPAIFEARQLANNVDHPLKHRSLVRFDRYEDGRRVLPITRAFEHFEDGITRGA